MSRSEFVLDPVPPFRLDLTAWILRRRPDNAVDRWDGQTYRRVLDLSNQAVEVAVTQIGPSERPQLQVQVTGMRLGARRKAAVTAALEQLLGLRIDLAAFERFAARQARLRSLVRRFRGMKPPRFPSLFECLVNGIACQQVSLTVGIRLLNRLAATSHGAMVNGVQPPLYAFPRPQDLAGLGQETIRRLGFSHQKARALIELASAVAEGNLHLDRLAVLEDEAAVACLRQLRGVGRWTAEYVLLRGLGRLHVFPGDDVGARNHLRRWLGLAQPLDYEGVRHTLARWRTYGGLIYFHLLLQGLAAAGYLKEEVQW